MKKEFYNKRLFILGLIIAAVVAFLDLYSKSLVFNFLDDLGLSNQLKHPQLAITNFFNLVQVWNKGISFGMFNKLDGGKYIILSANLIILAVLLVWLYKNEILYLTWAIGLIIGGAAGNIIDRILNDAVADFLDFYIGEYHWPAFNLADSAVFLGVALLLLENYFIKPRKNEK